jgi:hypothetical protein
MLSAASCAFGQDDGLSLSWLPDRLMMPHFAANSTAHGISLTRILKNNQYIGGMGSMVPLVTATIDGHEVQFVVGGTLYTQILRSSNHLEVVNADFYVDVLADYRLDEERILRFGYGHTSQHLVDDAFEILGYGHSINYVRDYFQMFLLQRIAPINGFVYGGAFYHYRFKIPQPGAHHWLLQVGGEGLNEEITKNLFVYLAADIKFREESGYATTQNYQVGLRLRGSTHSLRLAFGHRTGIEERGQFYNQRIHWNTLGFFYDF